MPPRIVLGTEPAPLLVLLTTGAGFAAQGHLDGGAVFGIGDTLELRFDHGGPWPAAITGGTFRWDRTAADVAALIGVTPTAAALWYTAAGGQPFKWAAGDVKVQP